MTVVLITGASRGLGLELTRQYAADGATVLATCRDPAGAGELRALAARHPATIRVEALDVTDHGAIDALAAKYRGQPVDILINNAGDIGPRDPARSRIHEQHFGTINYAEWRRVLEINTLSPAKVAEAFVEHVAASGRKLMVFVSSTTGSNVEGIYPTFAYCSSKAALNKVVTMLAIALKPRGISCAAVCPGYVRTKLGGDAALLGVEESITGLRRVIAGLDLSRTGTFTRYNGETIPW
ncbi:MAG: SDR family oxidoreductase [Chromatiales bacterium]|nr:SDR family oxidoreductase [Chromatiales bacterium]